jgi:thiosulfate reductase cytochrome b subunit
VSKTATCIYRHSLLVRATHWVAFLSLTLLLMSGLQIFNAHPALYWGRASNFAHPVASIDAVIRHDEIAGMTTVLGHKLITTGVLGVSGTVGDREERAFPRWATLPTDQNLAAGRHWHFFFGWVLLLDGFVYFTAGLLGGHIWRDLVPSRHGMRRIGRSVVDHLRLRFPRGAEARHYNVLQQLSYLVILLVVLPILVLTGLTMSPGLDAAVPFLPMLFGGRQSARTIHFIAAAALLGFVVVHVAMVVLSGMWNSMRSMITGWYVIKLTGEVSEQ